MSTAAHTVAPWVLERASNPGEWANIYGANNRPICALYIGNPDREAPDEEDHINANLILAAPLLLAACKLALRHYNVLAPYQQREIAAAIAVAEPHAKENT